MSENITVPLKPDSAVEPFAERERNLIQVQVGIGGVWHCGPDCIVSVSLSREAMLGLGTALLRAAYAPPEKATLLELLPSEPGFASLTAGVYMHPQSCRLNLQESELGDLAHVLNEKA